MPKPTDYEILCQLDRGLPVPVVADQMGIPIRRVSRVATSDRSAHDPQKPPAFPVGFRLPRGFVQASDPSPGTAPYWAGLRAEETPAPRCRPKALYMVADDRADEEISFEDLLATTEAVFDAEGRKGRGAA